VLCSELIGPPATFDDIEGDALALIPFETLDTMLERPPHDDIGHTRRTALCRRPAGACLLPEGVWSVAGFGGQLYYRLPP
jgi:hypothetical protein